MPNMFGFSRRRTKLGRLKVHLGDTTQPPRSPARPQTKRPARLLAGENENENENENVVGASANCRSDELGHCSPSALDVANKPESLDNWVAVSTDGDKPTPRFNHAAAIVGGTKMIVVGGDSGRGLLDDTLILSLDKLTWAAAAPKVYLSSTGLPLKIPGCKGHSLLSWGKMVLLVGGKTDPMSEGVSVWSFDIETECWSHVEAKGDIPAARSGHSVIRAGPALILFGGEDGKGRKLNDLHMFDLKSLIWLPLHYTGNRPSPRSNHVSTLYDDKVLLVFGGQSKSKILNDLYSLDFETMVWSRMKIRGYHPSPRAGCGGALCGTKWYISGGGSKKKRHEETLIFDISKLEWSIFVTPPGASITIGKGFSLVPVHHKDKTFLVAFGGSKKEPSNQVEILAMLKNEHSNSWRSAPDTDPLSFENCPESSQDFGADINNGPRLRSFDSVVRQSLASAMEQSISGRKSLSDSTIDPNSIPGSVSLRKQFDHEEDYGFDCKMQTSLVGEKYKDCDDCSISQNPSSQVIERRTKQQENGVQVDIAGSVSSVEEKPVIVELESSGVQQKHGINSITSYVDHNISIGNDGTSTMLTNPSNIYHWYEAKISTLITKNAMLEEQLAAALSSQEAAEKNLSSCIKAKQEGEGKLSDIVKEVDLLKEKLASEELAHKEANNLSNIAHSDNVRLEHDVAFLKAVLDDTQKELHSTRGVLAGERARAFQLQVEVFHLKQKLQSVESRAPTARKPYQM